MPLHAWPWSSHSLLLANEEHAWDPPVRDSRWHCPPGMKDPAFVMRMLRNTVKGLRFAIRGGP